MTRSLLSLYVLLLGIALGVEIAAGAFVAPVIFHPERYLGTGVLTHFQSGILMTQVFLKMNMLISVVALYSILYEVFNWIRKKESDIVSLLLSFIALVLTSLFVFYYTSFIVDAQMMRESATSSIEFTKMHHESEWVIKVLMMVQVVLLLRKTFKRKES